MALRDMGSLVYVYHSMQQVGLARSELGNQEDFTFNIDSVRVPQKFYRDRNNMRGANPGDVWQFSHVHYCNANRQNHPTQKPEGLIERMVLASSNEGQLVVDPFMGSGTTLRVCQQLKRRAIGIDINPEYVDMTKNRLLQPFDGFDSVDPRMERVPNDLRRPEIREEYLANHVKWFLSNHSNAIDAFQREVKEKYGVASHPPKSANGNQGELF
jgi:site-specific DNA-methyltransferase (adenine-specific)